MTDLHSLHATRRQLKATITVMEKETGARTRPQRVLLLQTLRDMERLYADSIAAELRRLREAGAEPPVVSTCMPCDNDFHWPDCMCECHRAA